MHGPRVWDDATVNTQDVPGTVDPGSYGTRRGANRPIEVGLVDPAWTRLAVASVVPVLLAVSAALPAWVRLIVVVLLVPLTAQGWPALVRTRHDQGATGVITLTGLTAAVLVAITNDFGMAGVVMALSVPAAFIAQMARRDGRKHLVEDLSATVTGNLVMISGAGWCALRTGIADPAVIVPCTLALFTGALLTTLNVRATVLEVLTMTVPALVAGAAGGALAMVGFFGVSHVGPEPALQSAAACLVTGFVAGVLMAAANRVLWTHRWVPGGRAAVASAIVPILSLGAPVYAIARLMGGFIAG
ncbi:tellurium resistance protein TerC [Actinomyces succiniciruminis]|uniref:Conserved domain protein n=1 Tax=Actinomyces succiniciruminis TaxID=1522002 RepID=A0A1L7RN29_9ACTO|nr:tellurium resistance protein TerC [Actinomyces succiniciruminis]CED90878.1 Conserved domain protein [Actinomyces succiniciruminis]